MARKTLNYTVQDEGRDKGKVFVLTEMPSSQAEAWAIRALLALIENGVQVPPGFEKMGMAGIAELGIRALSGLKWETAEPLLTEMWQCIRIMPDPSKPNVIRNLIEEDIEEVMTRVKLRAEIWELHTGFSMAVAPSNSVASPAEPAAAKKPLPLPNIKTSRR